MIGNILMGVGTGAIVGIAVLLVYLACDFVRRANATAERLRNHLDYDNKYNGFYSHLKRVDKLEDEIHRLKKGKK